MHEYRLRTQQNNNNIMFFATITEALNYTSFEAECVMKEN